jgi:membrane peptidoglycan carboxypeptidase
MLKKSLPILGVRKTRTRPGTVNSQSRRSFKRKPLSGKSRKLLILTYVSSFVLIGMIGGTIGLFILFAVFSRELPNPYVLLERNTELSTKLYDRNGTPVFEVYGEKNRQLITLDRVNPHVVHATLAIEDSSFYQHQGFSIRGMVRAARNTLTGSGLQGGSTLTQQVVKNVLLTQDRTITRKIKELILSLQLENRYAKDEIIQMYLNETPMEVRTMVS